MDTPPIYDPRETVTRQRIRRGLTPIKRKWKDYRRVRSLIQSWATMRDCSFDTNGIPHLGDKVFSYAKRTYTDKFYPPGNRDTRHKSREKQQWWQQATDTDDPA